MRRIGIALLGLVASISASLAVPIKEADIGQALKGWFTSINSKKGSCSDASTEWASISGADFDIRYGHFYVKFEGIWHAVPDDAVVTEQNLYEHAMVWAKVTRGIYNSISRFEVICFIPPPAK